MKVSLGPCKGKDFANTLGPWIVTADEFVDRHDAEGFLPISMAVEVNGEAIGQDLLSNMGWPFAELVAYASQDSVVRPGDVLGSGTCGSGCLAELWGRNGAKTPPPLKDRRRGPHDRRRHRHHREHRGHPARGLNPVSRPDPPTQPRRCWGCFRNLGGLPPGSRAGQRWWSGRTHECQTGINPNFELRAAPGRCSTGPDTGFA